MPSDAGRGTRKQVRRPRKVVIVGGGCAGMTAAWELWQRGYDVSVYERSWRLGGKGASGRDEQGRIVEHGLHVWLGFYENAFRMIRDCYEEVEQRNWGPHREEREARLAHGSFEAAFFPEPHIGVAGQDAARDWMVWSGQLPPASGLPGDPLDPATNPFSLRSYLLRCVDLLRALMLSVIERPDGATPGDARPEDRSDLDEQLDAAATFDVAGSPDVLIKRIALGLRNGTLTAAAAVLQAVTIFQRIVESRPQHPDALAPVLNLLRALADQARKQLRDFVAVDERLRWKTEIIDIVMTITVGLYRDRVLLDEHGLDALNDVDYREWLLTHGATKSAVQSRFIKGIYDFAFAYEGGDHRRPKLAAGVALRGALRMFFTYRGAMFWRMRSGMGDAVFAPLFKVMQAEPRPSGKKTDRDSATRPDRRPVRFHFLHALSRVTFDLRHTGRRLVTGLEFSPVGDALFGDAGAEALDHLGCWPAGPEHLQAVGRHPSGAARTLRVGDDFDAVIFAMGRDDVAELLAVSGGGRERAERRASRASDEEGNPAVDRLPKRWKALRKGSQTVATRSAQVWLAKDLEQLGWYRGSGIVAALDSTFDTWADMTHTLPSEAEWRRTKAESGERRRTALDDARSLAYFCGVRPDGELETMERETIVASRDLSELMRTRMSVLWPGLDLAGDRDVLSTYVQINAAGSDRYSLSLPGSIRDRMSPLDCDVRNLTVAGDWTACGLDVGCVEAAVISGRLAAHAIDGSEPSLASIIGYDHP